MTHSSETVAVSQSTPSVGPPFVPNIDWAEIGIQPDNASNRARQEFEEADQLEKFLAAYESITGERLVNIDREQKGERPDFICSGADGVTVGIELTEVPHKALVEWDRLSGSGMVMSACELLDAVRTAIFKKESKRTTGDWRPAHKYLLVIILEEYGFDSSAWLSDVSLQEDLGSKVFDEIWICDNTTIDAHGTSQLVGLHPLCNRGLHRPSNFDPKPFG